MPLRCSIIVPAYNVAPYLERCLTSCLQQDIPQNDYEIVVVNDGSTDNTLAVAEEIASSHPNIRIISQENGGLSRARNAGLKEAKGEYVWFVDSDDFIAENFLGALLGPCQEKDLDFLGMNMARVMPDGSISERIYYDASQAGQVQDGPSALRSGWLKQPCAPFYLIRRSFLQEHGLSFCEGLLHEDEDFTPRMFYLARKASVLDRIGYYARIRGGSIMTTPNPKRAFDLLTVAGRLDAFSRESVASQDRHLFSLQISRVTDSCLKLCRILPDDVVGKVNAFLSENRWIAGHFLRSRDARFMLAGCLFRLFPKRMVSVYKALLKLAGKK